jgi:hypothetical protein
MFCAESELLQGTNDACWTALVTRLRYVYLCATQVPHNEHVFDVLIHALFFCVLKFHPSMHGNHIVGSSRVK